MSEEIKTNETKETRNGFAELLQCVAWVQQNLEAPKGQYNSFGKYKYRSLEDILAAVKPLLKKAKLYLNISYDPITVDGWHYVQATARLYYYPTGDYIESRAVAREDDDRKGMTAGQLSGATCSYAGKYALGGLLGIDDAKDLDTDEFKRQRQN